MEMVAFALGVWAALLFLAAAILPTSLPQALRLLLPALAVVAFVISLSLYAFSEDIPGKTHWETHEGVGRVLWAIALLGTLLPAAIAASVRQRPQSLRLVSRYAALTLPVLWWLGVFGIVSK